MNVSNCQKQGWIGVENIRNIPLCGLSKFQVRKTESIITHIFCSLRAFCQLEIMRIKETIESWYSLQRELSLKVAREFILEQLSISASLTS